jgi:allantoinase
VADFGGFEYDSDYYGDDLPFWMKVRKSDGSRGAAPHRALHAGLQRHALFLPQGFSQGDPSSPTCATASMRCMPKATPRRMKRPDDEHGHALPPAGRPGRILALQRFLDHIAKHDRVWVCRRIDIARHWKQVHPYKCQPHEHHAHHPGTTQHAPPAEAASCWTACTSIQPWIAEPPGGSGPFRSLAHLKHA